MTDSTATPPLHASSAEGGLLMRMLMGHPGPVRQGIKRLMLALPSYLFVCALLLIGARIGRVEPVAVMALTGYLCLGVVAFYALLRSGAAAASADSSLAYPQVIFQIGAVALAYALLTEGRGVALQWLCIILVFDMRRLSSGQVRLATMIAIGLLLATVGVQWIQLGNSMNLASELINVGMACVTLTLLLFVAKVARRMRHQQDEQRTALQQALAQMHELSVRDGLTKLYNRRHLLGLLDEEKARHQRSAHPLCLALMDIDHFKKVNDLHGHAVGDVVLREFSLLAQGAADAGQVLGRWGGEEFLLLMPDTTPAKGLQVIERLRLAVRRHDWQALVPGLAVSFSAGLCEHQAKREITQTLELADQALYRAKAEGRDRVIAAQEVPS